MQKNGKPHPEAHIQNNSGQAPRVNMASILEFNKTAINYISITINYLSGRSVILHYGILFHSYHYILRKILASVFSSDPFQKGDL